MRSQLLAISALPLSIELIQLKKTAAIQVDMTEYLAVWIPKKMTWGDLCAVASAAADLLDWLADRNAWVEQKKTRSKNKQTNKA